MLDALQCSARWISIKERVGFRVEGLLVESLGRCKYYIGSVSQGLKQRPRPHVEAQLHKVPSCKKDSTVLREESNS